MAFTMHVSQRLTNRYVGTYKHLDQWGPNIPVKVLGGVTIKQGNDYDEGQTMRVRVIGPKNVDQKMLAGAIRETMGSHGCAHEYDCCGCSSVHARVTKVKRGIFSVLLTESFNY